MRGRRTSFIVAVVVGCRDFCRWRLAPRNSAMVGIVSVWDGKGATRSDHLTVHIAWSCDWTINKNNEPQDPVPRDFYWELQIVLGRMRSADFLGDWSCLKELVRWDRGALGLGLTETWDHVEVSKNDNEQDDSQNQQGQVGGCLIVVFDVDLLNKFFWPRSRSWLMAVKLARLGKSCDRPLKLGRRWAVTRGKQTTPLELANAGSWRYGVLTRWRCDCAQP